MVNIEELFSNTQNVGLWWSYAQTDVVILGLVTISL